MTRWTRRAGGNPLLTRRWSVIAAVVVLVLSTLAVAATSASSPGSARPSFATTPIPIAPSSRVGPEHLDRAHDRGRYVTPRQVLAEVGTLPRGLVGSVHVLEVDGLERYYLEIAPGSERGVAAHGLPIYVVLHGRHMDPASIERLTSFPRLAGHAVFVYPAGVGESWDAGGCCGYAHAHRVDDVAFIAALVHHLLSSDPATSPKRVYAAGFSNGGRMTYRLACDLPGTFAGIAAVEAVPVITCRHLRPLDIEIVARAHDPLLRFGNQHRLTIEGYLEPTVTDSVTTWMHLDGCTGSPTRRLEGTTLLTTWANCRDGTSVQYTLYAGSGHYWSWSHSPNPAASDLVLARLGHDLRG